MRRALRLLGLAILLLTGGSSAAERVAIEFFHTPGCAECEWVRTEILPELEIVFSGQYDLWDYSLSEPENTLRLMAYQDSLDVWDNEPVSMVVAGRVMLSGVGAIREGLLPAVREALSAGMPQTLMANTGNPARLEGRFQKFTVAAVTVAGLIDSLNPCAVSTLVFFMSVLAVAHVRGRRLAIAGAAFIAASFLTYFLLGFGILGVLRALVVFHLAGRVFRAGMALLMAVMAVLSFHDAWRFHCTGDPDQVQLQLPGRIKQRIHSLMRREIRMRSLAAGGSLIGASVTLLESVCTGQVYVPALVLMIHSGRFTGRALCLLALYNLMFVIPLIIVFVLVYNGLQMPSLVAWSRRNVVPGKLLMGTFFLVATALIILF